MGLFGIYLSLNLLLLSSKIHCQVGLQCYVCNSNFRKCGDAGNFDSSVQTPSYCYGSCLKIVVSPGDFIIRSCSTLFENSFLIQNITSSKNFAQNQCYLGTYQDPLTESSRDSYVCFCNDKTGCNHAVSKFQNSNLKLLIFSLVNIFLVK